MEIDISSVQYEVELITEDGTLYTLTGVLTELQWEEQKKELSQRAKLTVANITIGNTYLMGIAKINCIVRIYGRWSGIRRLVLEGRIWDWQYESKANKELSLTVYDPMIKLQQSDDCFYYPAGMTTSAIIGDICNAWGIPFEYVWDQCITHEKQATKTKISDMIISLLDEVSRKTGKQYVAHFRDGKLRIAGRGSNAEIYIFDGRNTESTSNTLTINDLVTRVKIIGKQNDDGRTPVEDVVDGDTRFGVLQKIISRDSSATLQAVRDEANTLLKERGKPDESIQVNVPDLPFVRKGDKVSVSAGNLTGSFFVDGVTHNATSRQMTLALVRG